MIYKCFRFFIIVFFCIITTFKITAADERDFDVHQELSGLVSPSSKTAEINSTQEALQRQDEEVVRQQAARARHVRLNEVVVQYEKAKAQITVENREQVEIYSQRANNFASCRCEFRKGCDNCVQLNEDCMQLEKETRAQFKENYAQFQNNYGRIIEETRAQYNEDCARIREENHEQFKKIEAQYLETRAQLEEHYAQFQEACDKPIDETYGQFMKEKYMQFLQDASWEYQGACKDLLEDAYGRFLGEDYAQLNKISKQAVSISQSTVEVVRQEKVRAQFEKICARYVETCAQILNETHARLKARVLEENRVQLVEAGKKKVKSQRQPAIAPVSSTVEVVRQELSRAPMSPNTETVKGPESSQAPLENQGLVSMPPRSPVIESGPARNWPLLVGGLICSGFGIYCLLKHLGYFSFIRERNTHD